LIPFNWVGLTTTSLGCGKNCNSQVPFSDRVLADA
jgi:hypothetical protein